MVTLLLLALGPSLSAPGRFIPKDEAGVSVERLGEDRPSESPMDDGVAVRTGDCLGGGGRAGKSVVYSSEGWK